MISAAELRARQAEKLSSRKDEFGARFKKASDEYYETIMSEVKFALEAVQDSSFTYVILNYKPLTKDFEGLKYTTVLYGYWNKERESFDDSIFAEQEVEKPFERAKKELAELGYTLENVSDPSVSHKLFLRLSWGDSPVPPRKPVARKPRYERRSERSERSERSKSPEARRERREKSPEPRREKRDKSAEPRREKIQRNERTERRPRF
jgi:Asp-tRNA(Asn)/Glu-tRNA(Gln) amidotransferase A subunit family amidase